MRRSLIALGALAATAALPLLSAGQAQAAPTCTTTLTAVSGVAIAASNFVSGFCVIAGDKTFGNFSATGGSGIGSASFTFSGPAGNVTLGILDSIDSSVTTSASLSYQVAVTDAAALAAGWHIDDITKDFTLNQAVAGLPAATATLSGISPEAGFNISCTRHDPSAPADTCPVHTTFSPLLSMTVNESLTLGPNTIVTGITDTISQIQVAPEPASLGLLGTGLLGLGLLARRRRR